MVLNLKFFKQNNGRFTKIMEDQTMADHLIFLISGILSGCLVTYFIMRYRASVYQESAEQQFSRYKKEAVLMKGNIAEKEDRINSLTASISEKETDIRNLQFKIDEQKESAEQQFSRFEKEAALMKYNIAAKEDRINSLTASISEKEADIRNLRVKIDEQKEDLEKMNERLKDEFRNLINEILEAKNQKNI